MMLITGYINLISMKATAANMSTLDQMSMANLIYSEPICITQYIGVNETRWIDCNVGTQASYMTDLTASGIVPANTSYDLLNQCANL